MNFKQDNAESYWTLNLLDYYVLLGPWDSARRGAWEDECST